MRDFCAENESELFVYSNGERFAGYLETTGLSIRYWKDLVMYELALAQTQMDGISRVVDFHFDPYPVLECLENYMRPEIASTPGMLYSITISQDEANEDRPTAAAGYKPVFHN